MGGLVSPLSYEKIEESMGNNINFKISPGFV